MQLFPALIPIFISLARFPGALRPPSYAPSISRKEKTRARSKIMGISFGLSVSTSRRNRVHRFQIVVPIRSTSSHFGVAMAPNLLGKLEIWFVVSSDSVPDCLEAAAVGNWDSKSAAKAVHNNESADEGWKGRSNLQRIAFRRLSFSGRADWTGAMLLSFRR